MLISTGPTLKVTDLFKKILLLFILILPPAAFTLAAQEDKPAESPLKPKVRMNQHSKGDQSFLISAGAVFPLFTVLLNDIDSIGYSAGVHSPKLTIGGAGGLGYNFYLNGNIKLGIALNGTFEWDINRNLLYMIPVTAAFTYEFHPFSRLSVPLHIDAGINMTSWKDEFTIDPILKAGFGVNFDWNVEWSFGIDASYWFIIQTSSKDPQFDSLANFMTTQFLVEYHF